MEYRVHHIPCIFVPRLQFILSENMYNYSLHDCGCLCAFPFTMPAQQSADQCVVEMVEFALKNNVPTPTYMNMFTFGSTDYHSSKLYFQPCVFVLHTF